MRSVVDTANFPVIRHVSDTKDTEYHPQLAGDHFTLKAVWKGHIKSDENAFNKILLCFIQPLNLKVYHSHYEFFDGEFLIGTMYCMF